MHLVWRCLIKTLQLGFVLSCCTLFIEKWSKKEHTFSFVAFKEQCKENSFLCSCYGVRDVFLLCCKRFFLLTSTFYFSLDKSLDFSKKILTCLLVFLSHVAYSCLPQFAASSFSHTGTNTHNTVRTHTHFFLYFSHWLPLLHRWQVFSGCVQFSQPAVIMHNSLRYKTQAS